jgi:hypothetical protein
LPSKAITNEFNRAVRAAIVGNDNFVRIWLRIAKLKNTFQASPEPIFFVKDRDDDRHNRRAVFYGHS